jgi:hypothetical protein
MAKNLHTIHFMIIIEMTKIFIIRKRLGVET